MSLALPSRRWSWAACDLKIEQLQKTNQTLDKQIQDLLLNKEDVTRQIELERQERDIAVLEHAILKLRSDTVKSKNQLEEIRVELRAKIEGNNELNEALNQQKHKFEEIGGTEIELVSESGSTETEQGSCLPDKSLFLVNTFVKDLEQERNFYKAEVDYLLKMLRNKSCGQSNPSRGRSPVHSPPVKGGSYESELICIIKERDDLQNMLNKYERHMAEIQSNVKVLTAERDQNKLFFEQAQEELDRLHRDGVKAPRCPKNSLTAQDILRRLECERDEAAADLRRMITERDSLRERLKISQEAAINERAHLEQRIEDLKSSLHSLESERLEHRSRLTCLKDSVTSLEEEVKILARKSADTEDELCRQRSENNQIRLLMDQTEDTLGETQRRLSLKCTDLQLAQDKNARLCEKNDELNRQIACHQEELNSIRSDAYDFDKQKNCLQELVDEKTETITSLEESLHQKKKIIIDHEINLNELESTVEQLNETVNSKDNEICNLKRQCDALNSEIAEMSRLRDSTCRESNHLHEQLSKIKYDSQGANRKLEESTQEIKELKIKVQDYITEVSKVENLLNAKETENFNLMEQYRRANSQVETWELKGRQMEGENNSLQLELTSFKAENRRMCERLQSLEKEIEEVLSEHESARSEIELLRNQLASERTAIKNLESLLASNREKKYQSQMATQEKEAEIQLFKDKLSLAESKLTSQSREMAQLRSKAAMLESELEMAKRQLGTERFERQVECAVQELRRHGPSYRCSSPPQPSLSPILHSTERSSRRSPDCSLNRSLNRASSLKEF
ncbi:testis-specific gene 10 protein isoform X4 [Callorhinchus milii]|uniref:testis-specific gene 10 protein isoform X4 n=1 Tax=Callorhinchus milii TaxID=7868 RepID=UPI000457616F|nr:testis-specific gene 10 protein isoform X4 [Callorhinchus milii]|eukprot:gi/632947981/ref/XP_007889344.1/ PREDICTED: testis-specific gene 10 protein isoform X4 [Callorhinchus milii]